MSNLFPKPEEIPAEFKNASSIEQTEYLINGKIKIWKGEFKDVYSPICVPGPNGLEQVRLGKYPLLTEEESLDALQSSVQCYDSGRGIWPTLSVKDRIKCIEYFATRMAEKRDEIVKLLMWEIGKNLEDSEKEFDRTIEYIKDTIEEVKKLDRESSRFQMHGGILAQIRRAPLGIVLCMGPYNYPLNETFCTLIPALIMGNPVIIKPPKKGVLLYRPLLTAFRDCFPSGVVNIIYGEGAKTSGTLIKSGKIDVLAFIGSSKVANEIKKAHPFPHRLRSVLGLESKNPAIILPDADLIHTVNECVLGTLSYNGQRCTALKMIFIHSKIKNEFLRLFAKKIDEIKIGLPWDKGVKITPMPDMKKVTYMQELTNNAVKNGAEVINENGGKFSGTFYYPTALFPVNSSMKIYHEEQFGPVIPIIEYDNIEVPIDYIVNSPYGQQASIFGTNSSEIARLIDPLINQVCRININSQCQRGPDNYPFNGRKNSAEGTLSVFDALRVFSIRTLVAAKKTEMNEDILSKIVNNHQSNFLRTDYIF